MNPSLFHHRLPLVMFALMLLGWLVVAGLRMGKESPLESSRYDGWRYRLQEPEASFSNKDGGLEVLRQISPKAKWPAERSQTSWQSLSKPTASPGRSLRQAQGTAVGSNLSEGSFALMATKAGIRGRWLRSNGAKLQQLKPPFVALLHQPGKRYVLVRYVNQNYLIADDPHTGRVAYRTERFQQTWLGAKGYGMAYVLNPTPRGRKGEP